MKSIALTILFLIAGFICGCVYSRQSASSDFQQERESTMRFNSEMAVALTLMNIRFAESGNSRDAIRINCRIAKFSVRLVDPGFYDDPQKQKEIGDLVNRASRTISSLESSGKCSTGVKVRANNSFKPNPLRGSA